MRKKVLGVNIDDVSKEEALGVVESWLIKKDQILKRSDLLQPRLIFTPGPEFLVTAQNDEEFKKVLNSSDLNLPDGYGLKLFGGITHQVPGVDFMLALCQKAADRGWTVGMIGNPNTKLAAEKLEKKFPRLKIVFALDNPEANQVLMDYDILKNITSGTDRVDLLFVGVGHPKQEKFLWRFKKDQIFSKRSDLPQFRVGMAVGGSFDFISGRVWEPPEIFSKLGIKWLGRLVSRPGYMVPRIYRALVVYPWLLLKSRERS